MVEKDESEFLEEEPMPLTIVNCNKHDRIRNLFFQFEIPECKISHFPAKSIRESEYKNIPQVSWNLVLSSILLIIERVLNMIVPNAVPDMKRDVAPALNKVSESQTKVDVKIDVKFKIVVSSGR